MCLEITLRWEVVRGEKSRMFCATRFVYFEPFE